MVDTKVFPPAQTPHNIHLTCINEKFTILLLGSVDARIHICIFDTNVKSKSNIFANNIYHLNGHEEWVTCLCSKVINNNTLLFASGSKDTKIRIWKAVLHSSDNVNNNSSIEVKLSEIGLEEEIDDDLEEENENNKMSFIMEEENISESRLNIEVNNTYSFSFYLESLLVGHEDWLTKLIIIIIQ